MKQFNNLNNNRGFTFIELILYVSIVTIMLTSIIPFAWNIIGSGAKSGTQQEVFSQARFVSERIKYEIRNADGINSVSATSISLDTSTDPTTVIDLLGGKIRIKYGAATVLELNSDDTKITSLTFTDYSLGNTKHIGFALTVESNSPAGARQEFKETVTLRSSAEVRSN